MKATNTRGASMIGRQGVDTLVELHFSIKAFGPIYIPGADFHRSKAGVSVRYLSTYSLRIELSGLQNVATKPRRRIGTPPKFTNDFIFRIQYLFYVYRVELIGLVPGKLLLLERTIILRYIWRCVRVTTDPYS
jgi:hypothetical protein